LLFTISQKDFDKIKGNPNLTVVGYITDESQDCTLMTRANEKIKLIARGWNALKEE
ncbi:MAG: thiamine-phosphate kinase, partial [Lutimonas sp.]